VNFLNLAVGKFCAVVPPVKVYPASLGFRPLLALQAASEGNSASNSSGLVVSNAEPGFIGLNCRVVAQVDCSSHVWRPPAVSVTFGRKAGE